MRWSLFLTNLLTGDLQIKKETPAVCEFRKMFKNTISYKTPSVAASEKNEDDLRNHSFSMFAKLLEKLTFHTS